MCSTHAGPAQVVWSSESDAMGSESAAMGSESAAMGWLYELHKGLRRVREHSARHARVIDTIKVSDAIILRSYQRHGTLYAAVESQQTCSDACQPQAIPTLATGKFERLPRPLPPRPMTPRTYAERFRYREVRVEK